MGNRRRSDRFFVPDAAQATLRLMQDVWIERVEPRTAIVASEASLRVGEAIALELPCDLHARSTVHVVVHSVRPSTAGERRRFRAVLRVPEAAHPHTGPTARGTMAPIAHLPAVGVIVRRVPVRVRDVSVSGCLIESPDALPDGAIALLELAVGGELHVETLRVCRVSRVAGGAWPWRAGAQFLALGAPPPTSVRNMVARFEILEEMVAGDGRKPEMGRPLSPSWRPATGEDFDREQRLHCAGDSESTAG